MLGDLPGLAAHELEQALLMASTVGRTFVSDAETGSVLASASAGIEFSPRFGPDSGARHRAAGFTELHVPASWGLRRDVDTVEHLWSCATPECSVPTPRPCLVERGAQRGRGQRS